MHGALASFFGVQNPAEEIFKIPGFFFVLFFFCFVLFFLFCFFLFLFCFVFFFVVVFFFFFFFCFVFPIIFLLPLISYPHPPFYPNNKGLLESLSEEEKKKRGVVGDTSELLGSFDMNYNGGFSVNLSATFYINFPRVCFGHWCCYLLKIIYFSPFSFPFSFSFPASSVPRSCPSLPGLCSS